MIRLFFIFLLIAWQTTFAAKLPEGFVYLKEIDPSIQQEMRYKTNHNFIGRPIRGYQASTCILSKPAALALKEVQTELRQSNLSLKVYDCYRPQMAVDDFYQWSQNPAQQEMKIEFYPRVDKKELFNLGYIAAKSGHTRGSTMDLTIIPIPSSPQEKFQKGKKLVTCFSDYKTRFQDNTIDMGTGYDCLDPVAHDDTKEINLVSAHNRQLFRDIMEKYHFVPYSKEWWHFTLKDEPYPDTYFNFPVA